MYILTTPTQAAHTSYVLGTNATKGRLPGMGNAQPNQDLGKRIRSLRKHLKESQAVFADRFGVEQPTVSRWERGFLPERAFIPKLAALAGMSEADFVYGEDAKVRHIPVLSWVAATSFTSVTPASYADADRVVTLGGLGNGEYFALQVRGDSMDRVAPDSAIIVVDYNDTSLQNHKFYVIEYAGDTTFKRADLKPPLRFSPYSTNPQHEPIFPEDAGAVRVLGRVVKVISDL